MVLIHKNKYDFYSSHYTVYCNCKYCKLNSYFFYLNVFAAVPDADEDPKVTRAKFFIRDEFLVKMII